MIENRFSYLCEEQNVKGFLCVSHFLGIVETINGQHTLIDKEVLARILFEQQIFDHVGKSVGHELIEDVVVALGRLLKSDPRLFQQIRLNVSASDSILVAKVNANEFALGREREREIEKDYNAFKIMWI